MAEVEDADREQGELVVLGRQAIHNLHTIIFMLSLSYA